MCLRGEAQKLLDDLTLELRSDYDRLKSVLTKRFNPEELNWLLLIGVSLDLVGKNMVEVHQIMAML
jgi:hypothetical protein